MSYIGNTWKSIVKGDNGVYVAVGIDSLIMYSTDGSKWSTYHIPYGEDWNWVTYGGGKFVVYSDKNYFAYTSTDGINWGINTYSVFSSMQTGNSYSILKFLDGKFFAWGSQNSQGCRCNKSSDGETWLNTGDTQQIYIGYVKDAVQGDTKSVAIGQFYAITKDNGTDRWWRENSMPGHTYINAVTYVDGYFVAGGRNGKLFISKDGKDWTEVENSDTEEIYSMCPL